MSRHCAPVSCLDGTFRGRLTVGLIRVSLIHDLAIPYDRRNSLDTQAGWGPPAPLPLPLMPP